MPDRYTFFREKKISLLEIRTARKIFLAEGLSEALFLERLFEERSLNPHELIVFCFKGVNNFGPILKLLNDEENFSQITSLGIMLDADSKPKYRLNSVLRECRKIEFISDKAIMTEPGIFREEGRNLGIFVSPGEEKNGSIETLIMSEIEERPEFACLEELVNCLRNLGCPKLSEKALCQMFISLKRDRVCGAGRGFQAGIFDITHSAYEQAARIFMSV